MAGFARVNGTAQPVFHMDVGNGSIAGNVATAATPVNFQGPKLDFFSVTANATVAGSQGVIDSTALGYVSTVLQSVQQLSTVAVYQVDGTQISFGVFPTGAFANNAAFLAVANVPYTGFQLNSAAGIGFKLATA